MAPRGSDRLARILLVDGGGRIARVPDAGVSGAHDVLEHVHVMGRVHVTRRVGGEVVLGLHEGLFLPPGVVGEDLHGGGVRLLRDVARTIGLRVQDAAGKNDLLLVEGHEDQAHHGRGGGP